MSGEGGYPVEWVVGIISLFVAIVGALLTWMFKMERTIATQQQQIKGLEEVDDIQGKRIYWLERQVNFLRGQGNPHNHQRRRSKAPIDPDADSE